MTSTSVISSVVVCPHSSSCYCFSSSQSPVINQSVCVLSSPSSLLRHSNHHKRPQTTRSTGSYLHSRESRSIFPLSARDRYQQSIESLTERRRSSPARRCRSRSGFPCSSASHCYLSHIGGAAAGSGLSFAHLPEVLGRCGGERDEDLNSSSNRSLQCQGRVRSSVIFSFSCCSWLLSLSRTVTRHSSSLRSPPSRRRQSRSCRNNSYLDKFIAGSSANIGNDMAASAVASPVLYKLDSIPNDLPVGSLTASGTLSKEVKRNGRLVVIGHRGCGKNNALSIGDVPDTRLSIRENTIRSFNLAASNGADYVEFDVQVTKDGHPVIFHDDLIFSENEFSRIGDLTLEEFLAFGPQSNGMMGKKIMRRRGDGTLKPWSATLEDSLCTLKDVFELVQPSLGLNIEVKFHDTEETHEPELRRVISAILKDVENYAKGRMVIFSTFHPSGAIILRQEQQSHSVFFLTCGGEHIYQDPRRNSVEAAISICKENGLQGIVTEVFAILKRPELATQVKDAGLSLLTYGDMNNVAEALVQQYVMNVDGVIVDCVREIVTASRTLHALLNFVQPDWSSFLEPSPSQPVLKSPSKPQTIH